jgi:hypothetical protein
VLRQREAETVKRIEDMEAEAEAVEAAAWMGPPGARNVGAPVFRCNFCKALIPEATPRWHCTECTDYDLCGTCYVGLRHAEHA